ncbi:MAG: SCP2 sterol-binding domain-containing protein [Thermoplasmatales archaeon]|nr:SCP2 sterol-binding domain-containing protein [Candidatus Thermoplasmatota archaeon]MCL6003424.1 SCP2 sterol-binding domain-containing protein [Candidatus Thermoplasmatota archaeon]MDA8056219.1 SCP2 sterol-binding domain-containing protein [Thermoplasmatales archaeon]
MTEKLTFPSEDWIKDYCSKLSSSAEYNRLGKGWQDPIQFKIIDLESVKVSLDFKSFVLEVKDGRCEGYRLVKDDSDSAPFVLSSSYSDWRRTLEGKVNPTQAMLSGSLKVKGNVMLLMKYAAAATEMVKVAGKIETEFIV